MELFPQILTIEPDSLHDYPLKAFAGEIVVVDTHKAVESAFQYLSKFSKLGFDTETKPNFKKGRKNQVALLQLSTEEKAYIFRTNKIGVPSQIASLMANPAIKKIGAATRDDVKLLKSVTPFESHSVIDLQTIVKNVGIQQLGLKNITALILGYKISKSQQLSNWEAHELTEAQKLYAATDAWVCLEIYKQLEKLGLHHDNS